MLHVVLAPPPVTFARSRRQSFGEFKSTSSQSQIMFLTKSVIFINVTDSDDYTPAQRYPEYATLQYTVLMPL
jgi:hypothetical protein